MAFYLDLTESADTKNVKMDLCDSFTRNLMQEQHAERPFVRSRVRTPRKARERSNDMMVSNDEAIIHDKAGSHDRRTLGRFLALRYRNIAGHERHYRLPDFAVRFRQVQRQPLSPPLNIAAVPATASATARSTCSVTVAWRGIIRSIFQPPSTVIATPSPSSTARPLR